MTPPGQHARLADRIKLWWLHVLDEDSVRFWVSPYCAVYLSWALFATFLLPPVTTIHQTMGPAAYWIWVWMAIPANALPIAGLLMRHGGSAIQTMSTRLLFRDWMGLVTQAMGHIWCHALLVMFQIGAWIAVWTYSGPQPYAGLTVFCGVMLLPWTFGTFVLFAQTIRKIQRGIELEHQSQEVSA